jgi:ribonuclease HI
VSNSRSRALHASGKAYIAAIDGASRGNPGPAAYGVILRQRDGKVVFELGKYLGRATNNAAEYQALLCALEYASAHGTSHLRVRSDSELLVQQMQGGYKVKSGALRPLYERARKLAQGLESFSIEYVPREENREADRLANQVLDRTDEPAVLHRPRVAGHGSRVRARYQKGALRPDNPLELSEGEEVEITIRRLRD